MSLLQSLRRLFGLAVAAPTAPGADQPSETAREMSGDVGSDAVAAANEAARAGRPLISFNGDGIRRDY